MSLIDHARSELKRINFGEEDSKVMIELLEKFFDTWDSGGAVWAVAPVFMKLLSGAPLSPLTGEDSEWFDHGPQFDMQNIRCGSVFKNPRTGVAHDIDAPEPRKPITFPYVPARFLPREPVIVV